VPIHGPAETVSGVGHADDVRVRDRKYCLAVGTIMRDLSAFTITDQEQTYYDKLWESESWGGREPNADELARWTAIEALIRHYALRPDRGRGVPRLVDVGCGRGWLTAKLGAFGMCEGLDPVGSSVTHARRLFPDLTFHAVDSIAHVSNGFAAAYDVAVSSEVIEHVRDAEKPRFLRSLADLTRPGGYVVITTPRGEVSQKWFRLHRERQPIEDWISAVALDDLAGQCGLERVARRRVFAEGNVFDSPASRLAHHWRVVAARSRHPRNLGIRLLDHLAAIYQVVLYRKTAADGRKP